MFLLWKTLLTYFWGMALVFEAKFNSILCMYPLSDNGDIVFEFGRLIRCLFRIYKAYKVLLLIASK